MQIRESGMVFGNYRAERVFKIEDSYLHKHVGTGIKSVEFILLRGIDKIFFIEAKSSTPQLETSWERYQEFLTEMTEKFIHSFHMLCAWYFGRLSDEEVGADIGKVPCAEAKFIFVLVIRGHKKEWLLPLQEELKQRLHYHKSIWGSNVIVMNDEIAKEYHFIA